MAEAARGLGTSPNESFETLGGEVCALGLPSKAHRELTKRIYDQLAAQAVGTECSVYQGSLGVHVEAIDDARHAIPDVAVVCGPEQTHPDDGDLVLNPIVLVEVLSASTYKRDHVDKRIAYTATASLRAYVVVDQYQRVVTLWSRTGSEWDARILSGGSVDLPGTKLRLEVDSIYE